MESKLKAVKARNEYILSMKAANTAMRKYFVEDLQELINVSAVTLAFLYSVFAQFFKY